MATAGPAVVALVTYRPRLVRTAVIFLVLIAVIAVIAVPAVPIAVLTTSRDLAPAPAAWTPVPPWHCVEHSGGDTRCPGG